MALKNQGNKRFKPYNEGDQVWIEGMNIKTLYPSAKLSPKRYGPFKVLEQLSEAIYRLEIPRHWKIHNVFHANLITPYKETELHGPNFTHPPPDLIEGEQEFEVKKILDAQPRGQGRKMHFLVKWKGYPTSDNSWEPRENLHADRLITEYNKKKQGQAEPKKKGVKSRRARTEEIIPFSSQQHSPLHHHHMSARSAPISSAAMDATRSPTPVSAPDNTPASGTDTAVRGAPPVINYEVLELLEEVASTSLQDYESEVPELEYPSEGSDVPLQLGRWTVPIVEIATTVTSTIDYNREAENDEEDDEAPVGFIPNDPLGRMFYPIYVKNPVYRPTRSGHEGRRLRLAPYIKYAPDYTMVFGTN